MVLVCETGGLGLEPAMTGATWRIRERYAAEGGGSRGKENNRGSGWRVREIAYRRGYRERREL